MTAPFHPPFPDDPDPHRHEPDRSLRLRPGATLWARWHTRIGSRAEDAQSTVEYALVLLGAAAVALALVAWVTRSDSVSRLFDAIVGRILSQAG